MCRGFALFVRQWGCVGFVGILISQTKPADKILEDEEANGLFVFPEMVSESCP